MSRRKKHLLVAFVVFLLAPVVVWAILNPTVVRCHLVAFSNLRHVKEDVYVAPDLDEEDLLLLLSMIADGNARVAGLFGAATAAPVILAGRDLVAMKPYLAREPAATYATVVGATHVVLGPKAFASIDLVAQELVHAEHVHRAGFWSYTFDTPFWFVEGLAMQVDERAEHSDAAWRELSKDGADAPSLESLATREGFFSRDAALSRATARREVKRWLDTVGRAGLLELIAGAGDGDFAARYAAIEAGVRSPDRERPTR